MKGYLALLFFVISGFFACQNSLTEQNSTVKEPVNKQKDYLTEGKQITASAFAALSGKLQSAMQESGVKGAVSYCNLTALPLIDSLSQAHNVNIRRTSLKYRNPVNVPTKTEVEVLNTFTDQLQKEKSLSPIIQEHTFYAPIMIAPPCLKCHGKIGETLAESDYKHILKTYPEDKAIGYVSGDLRGMWVVSFKQLLTKNEK